MKIYRKHRCKGSHATWIELANCTWPHSTVDGDGQFATVSCPRPRSIALHATLDRAEAHRRAFDRDGCRPGCEQHHEVIALDPAQPTARPADAVVCHAAPLVVGHLKGSPVDDDSTGFRCGGARVDGGLCRRPAGWGADSGERRCRDHGGSRVLRAAEAERLADQAEAFVRLALKARTRPLTPKERAELEAAVRDVLPALKTRRSAVVLGLAGLPLDGSVPEVPRSAVGSLGLAAARLFLREAEQGGEGEA